MIQPTAPQPTTPGEQSEMGQCASATEICWVPCQSTSHHRTGVVHFCSIRSLTASIHNARCHGD